MHIGEKIRKFRELKAMTQSNMAEKLNMSLSGYTKIERGISQPNLTMLERIAKVLNINTSELLSFDDKSMICIISDNSNSGDNHNNLYYGNNHSELEKAHLIIQHKNELIKQQEKMLNDKEREIATLNELIAFLKNR